jgi:hypothetical protein
LRCCSSQCTYTSSRVQQALRPPSGQQLVEYVHAERNRVHSTDLCTQMDPLLLEHTVVFSMRARSVVICQLGLGVRNRASPSSRPSPASRPVGWPHRSPTRAEQCTIPEQRGAGLSLMLGRSNLTLPVQLFLRDIPAFAAVLSCLRRNLAL